MLRAAVFQLVRPLKSSTIISSMFSEYTLLGNSYMYGQESMNAFLIWWQYIFVMKRYEVDPLVDDIDCLNLKKESEPHRT